MYLFNSNIKTQKYKIKITLEKAQKAQKKKGKKGNQTINMEVMCESHSMLFAKTLPS